MICCATQFKLKKLSLYGQFAVATYRVIKQLRRSDGLVDMRINPISLRTITVWRSQENMLQFRNTGAHLQAMKVSRTLGETISVIWHAETVPTWPEAIQRLARSKKGQCKHY